MAALKAILINRIGDLGLTLALILTLNQVIIEVPRHKLINYSMVQISNAMVDANEI